MNLFDTRSFDGKFMRPNSSLPIAGTIANTAFNRVLNEVKITTTTPLFQGMAVYVTGNAAGVNAGKGLAPNILNAAPATGTNGNAFVVDNANGVVMNGDDFPQVVSNQCVRVAMVGSGAELYLPCDTGFADGSVTKDAFWDSAANKLVATQPTAGFAVKVVILSQVVEGIKGKNDNGRITTESAFVVKVKI